MGLVELISSGPFGKSSVEVSVAEKQETAFTRIVLDILKPHKPSILELGAMLGKLKGIDHVSIILEEVDAETETIRATVEGSDVNYERLVEAVRKNGGVVHSIDEVSISKSKEKMHIPSTMKSP